MKKWMPDGAGSRARIGVLTPHLDAVPESEFQALAPDGVSVHSARVPLGMVGPDGEIIPKIDAAVARAFADGSAIDDAAALISAVNPTAIVYAFTSSSYVLGANQDELLRDRLQQRARDIPVVIQSGALITALHSLSAERIALIHPPWFSVDLDALGAKYFNCNGFDVLTHGPAKPPGEDGELTPVQLFDWILSHTPDNADAAVIAGGGFRAIGTIAKLEEALGRPVVSANQAAFWLALRISGVKDRLDGYGQIFTRQARGHAEDREN